MSRFYGKKPVLDTPVDDGEDNDVLVEDNEPEDEDEDYEDGWSTEEDEEEPKDD